MKLRMIIKVIPHILNPGINSGYHSKMVTPKVSKINYCWYGPDGSRKGI